MLEFKVNGQKIARTDKTFVASDSQNFLKASFVFSSEWDGITNKIAKFTRDDFVEDIQIVGESIDVPPEATDGEGTFYVTVYGGNLMTANKAAVYVYKSGLVDGEFPYEPTPGLFDQILTSAMGYANDAEQSATSAGTSETVSTTKATIATEQATLAQASAEAATLAKNLSEAAKTSAEGSANTALASAAESAQNLSDLLAMIGTDVCPLVGGKVPIDKLSATATHEVVLVESEAELLTLTAQRGDLAGIVEGTEDGYRRVVKSYQLMADDPAIADNWVVWGTSYAVNAGNATTAQNAENANMINNHRLVEIAAADWETTVKDPDTYYLVY